MASAYPEHSESTRSKMPLSTDTPQPIIIGFKDVDTLKDLTDKLIREERPVAIDAEGIRLGKDGRLTLLQIGTYDQQVYLVDVVNTTNMQEVTSGKRLLLDGGVKTLLEDQKVLKVLHSCYSDSAALFFQFGIELKNVFDTQVAHKILEETTGIPFPKGLRLPLLVEKYGGQSFDSRDLKEEFVANPEFWLQRPLTDEMIQYAAEDVTVLVPTLYELLDKKLKKESSVVQRQFKVQVDEEINEKINPEMVYKKRAARNRQVVRVYIKKMDARFRVEPSLASLNDTDKLILRKLKQGMSDWQGASQMVKNLEEKLVIADLDEMETDGLEDLFPWQQRRLEYMARYRNTQVNERALVLCKKLGVNLQAKK